MFFNIILNAEMDLKHVHGYKSPMVDLLRSNKASTACMAIRVIEVDNKNDFKQRLFLVPRAIRLHGVWLTVWPDTLKCFLKCY